MSYILNSVTLPNPQGFRREQIETGGTVVTIDGTMKKDITNRKERYTLTYQMLTQAEASDILTIWNTQTTVNFQSTETNMAIGATPVHVEIEVREYNTRGNQYREDIVIILTEVV